MKVVQAADDLRRLVELLDVEVFWLDPTAGLLWVENVEWLCRFFQGALRRRAVELGIMPPLFVSVGAARGADDLAWLLN